MIYRYVANRNLFIGGGWPAIICGTCEIYCKSQSAIINSEHDYEMGDGYLMLQQKKIELLEQKRLKVRSMLIELRESIGADLGSDDSVEGRRRG